MSKLLRNNSVNNASNFIKDVNESNYYVYFSLAGQWPANNTPTAVVDSVDQEQMILDNMLYGLRVSPADVQIVARRNNWSEGVVYQQFDTKRDYFSSNTLPQFYVVTDELKVYKCIYNNKNAVSTVKPTSTDVDNIFRTSDGYIWKYLYTVPGNIEAKFGDVNHLPVVANTFVERAAVPGAIYVIEVANTGAGYIQFNQGNLQNIVNANAVILDTTAENTPGFYNNTSFYLTENNSAVNKIISYDGTTRVATLENPLDIRVTLNVANTAGFFANDNVTQLVNNEALNGNILYVDTEGSRLTFTRTSGSNFLIGEEVRQASPVASGIIASANNTVMRLVQVTGTFQANNTITGAVSNALATLNEVNSINSISLTSTSTRWSPVVPLYKVGSPNVFTSVNAIQVTPDVSAEYIVSPLVTIDGDGAGAEAIAIANTINGAITSVYMVNPGRDYTSANVNVVGVNSTNTFAVAQAVLSPYYGHGANVFKELGASSTAIALNILGNETRRILVPGSFRALGVIRNPEFKDISFDIQRFDSIRLPFNNVSGVFAESELVYQPATRASGTVRYANNSVLILNDISGRFVPGPDFIGTRSGTEATAGVFETLSFSTGDRIRQEFTNAEGVVFASNSTVIKLTNVTGRFNVVDPIVPADGPTFERVFISSIRSVNNVATNFSVFNRVARVPIHTPTFSYENGDFVKQETSGAIGKIINTSVDLTLNNSSADLLPGSIVTQVNPSATGTVLYSFANYVMLVNVKNEFVAGSEVTTSRGNATVTNVHTALYLANNNDRDWVSSADGRFRIVNQRTGVVGYSSVEGTIRLPEITKTGGDLIYIQIVNPIIKIDDTSETFKLYVKF